MYEKDSFSGLLRAKIKFHFFKASLCCLDRRHSSQVPYFNWLYQKNYLLVGCLTINVTELNQKPHKYCKLLTLNRDIVNRNQNDSLVADRKVKKTKKNKRKDKK